MGTLTNDVQPATDAQATETVNNGAVTLRVRESTIRSRQGSTALATTLARRACAGQTKAGTACPAPATRTPDLDGLFRCFQHSTRNPEARRLARVKGGHESAASRYLPQDIPMPVLSDPEGVRGLLADTIQQVRTGKLAPNAGQCVVAAVNSSIKLAELAIAVQLREIERRLEERGK